SDTVRVSRDRGRTYPRATRRKVTAHRPDAPAAIEVYDRDGMTRCFVADFDVKGDAASTSLAAQEAADFAGLVAQHGGLTLTDFSPTGGRHVYVPLSEPVPWELARAVAWALKALYRTID